MDLPLVLKRGTGSWTYCRYQIEVQVHEPVTCTTYRYQFMNLSQVPHRGTGSWTCNHELNRSRVAGWLSLRWPYSHAGKEAPLSYNLILDYQVPEQPLCGVTQYTHWGDTSKLLGLTFDPSNSQTVFFTSYCGCKNQYGSLCPHDHSGGAHLSPTLVFEASFTRFTCFLLSCIKTFWSYSSK